MLVCKPIEKNVVGYRITYLDKDPIQDYSIRLTVSSFDEFLKDQILTEKLESVHFLVDYGNTIYQKSMIFHPFMWQDFYLMDGKRVYTVPKNRPDFLRSNPQSRFIYYGYLRYKS